ncbi:MAG: sulfate ABC transporter permease subunit CysT [Stellaceae bacterium]
MSEALALRPARRSQALPGFGPSLGLTVFVVTVLVAIPLGGLFAKAASLSGAHMIALLSSPRALAAFRLSFGLALAAAIFNGVAGLLIAWVLERYDFPGRRFFNAAVDLPFALPTAVAGIALTALYADDGLIGAPLAQLGIAVSFTPLGIFLALVFVGLPYTIRIIQPVLDDVARDAEEAALTLGAGSAQIFARVILPQLLPAVLTGAAMAFARGVGEYGSVIFIAGNMPGVSEIVPLLIVIRLEQFDYPGAALLGAAMLVGSLAVLLCLNLVATRLGRRNG